MDTAEAEKILYGNQVREIEFPLNQMLECEITASQTSNAGLEAIQAYLRAYLKRNSFYPGSFFERPDKWWTRWQLDGDDETVTSLPTLPKRISKRLYEYTGSKLSAQDLSTIGNLFWLHASKGKERYSFEVVDKVEWKAGDFGDVYSCFWESKPWSVPMILGHGGRAIRFFAQDDHVGLGRAWMLPYQRGWIVFNGYGLQRPEYRERHDESGKFYSPLQTRDYARLLATYAHVPYSRLKFSVCDSNTHPIWINNGGAAQWVGPELETDYVDLDWGSEEKDFLRNCQAGCGRIISLIAFGDRPDFIGTLAPNGEWYCPACRLKMYRSCAVCGTALLRSGSDNVRVWRETVAGTFYLCPIHFKSETFRCRVCRTVRHDLDRVWLWAGARRRSACEHCRLTRIHTGHSFKYCSIHARYLAPGFECWACKGESHEHEEEEAQVLE